MAARLETLAGAVAEPGSAIPTGWIWRLLSVGIVALAWEIAGRVPISFAFPTFSATMAAFAGLVANGELPRAYLSTLQPLLIGVAIAIALTFALRETGMARSGGAAAPLQGNRGH